MRGSSGSAGQSFSSPSALLIFTALAAGALLVGLLFTSEDGVSRRHTHTHADAHTLTHTHTHDRALSEDLQDTVNLVRPQAVGIAAQAARLREAMLAAAGAPLYEGPSEEAVQRSWDAYARRCAEKDAWVFSLWDTNRNLSYTAQMEVREALNTIGQHYIAKLAAPTQGQIKPCKRTVVSISTIPGRIERLSNLIRSIKAQSYTPDAILIAVPPFAPRLKQKYVVPEYLAKDPAITIVNLPVDFGPLSKIAAAIYNEKDPETCIITVDDDNEPRDYFFRLIATWAAVFPTSVIGESGWNKSCILGKLPYICGEGYDTYCFVRQYIDFMCHPETLPVYNIHQCISEVRLLPRACDVVMGVSNPLYRRGFFKDDFLDIAKEMVRKKIMAMLQAHQDAVAANDNAKMLADDILKMAQDALLHPEMQRDNVGQLWERISPPDALFLVDDVYISAYLAKEGVPRLIVPAVPETAKPPIELLPKRERVYAAAPKPPETQQADSISNVHALHGENGFNNANYAAVRFFRYIGFW